MANQQKGVALSKISATLEKTTLCRYSSQKRQALTFIGTFFK